MSLLPADHTGLQSRVEAALRRAAGLLDEPDPGGMPLSDAISRLRERLEDSAEDLMSVREQLATGDRLHARYALRFHALDDARAAAGRLRELTAPQAILDGAPEALCGASEFERSLVSLFGDGRMTAHAAYFHNDRAGGHGALQALSQRPVLLEHPLVEAELVRRRRATIVTEAGTGARVDPTWQAVMGWRSYAAAPLVMGSALIGIVHADRGAESQLDILDRDVLWQFTTSLAQIYERAMLHRQLRHEREQLRTFLEWLGARSGELTDSPVKLSTFSRRPRPPLAEAGATAPGAPIDDRAVFDGLLTRRELEVLRLLADGRSNRAIAEALTISQGTVKFHVNRILRKLRVTNRSQAVARYLRLLGAAIR